jgi:hypothetical protein
MLKGHPRSPIPADKWRTKVEKKTDGNYLRIPLIVEASKSKNVERSPMSPILSEQRWRKKLMEITCAFL